MRVRAAAICRTDIYAAEGRLPVDDWRILGHEFSGTIEETFYRSRFQIGERVVGNPVISCRDCSDCEAGNRHLCTNSTFIGLDEDGAFAEYIALPSQNLSRIPAVLPYPVATFFEPVAAAMAVLEAGISKDESILVLGSGRIARLTAEILKSGGFSNFEVSDDPGHRFDVVIETEGLVGRFERILSVLKPAGKLVVKSRDPESLSMPVLSMINHRINIRAVKYGSFGEALSFVIGNRDLLASWLEADWSLDEFEKAFEVAKQSEDKKVCFQLPA